MAKWAEAFAQSFTASLDRAQKGDALKRQFELEEDKMKAEEVFRGLQMEKMNEQIRIAEREAVRNDQFRYDSRYDARVLAAKDDLISVKGDKAFDRVKKTSGAEANKYYDINRFANDDELVSKEYFQLIKGRETAEWGMAKATFKEDQFHEQIRNFQKDIASIPLPKQKETPVYEEPGMLRKITSGIGGGPFGVVQGQGTPPLKQKMKITYSGGKKIETPVVNYDTDVDATYQYLNAIAPVLSRGFALDVISKGQMQPVLAPSVNYFGNLLQDIGRKTGGVLDDKKLNPETLQLLNQLSQKAMAQEQLSGLKLEELNNKILLQRQKLEKAGVEEEDFEPSPQPIGSTSTRRSY